MCVALGLLSFIEDSSTPLSAFFQKSEDIVNSTVLLLYSILIVVTMYWFYHIIKQNFKKA